MYELSDKKICFELNFKPQRLEACKKELAPKVLFKEGWVFVKNAEKYDPIRGEHNTLWKTHQNELEQIPERIKAFFLSPIDAPSMPHRSPTDGRNGNGIGKEKEERGVEGEKTKIVEFLEFFNQKSGKHYEVTKTRREKLESRLKKYSLEQIKKAAEALLKSPFHTGKNQDGTWYADPDFLLRNDEQIDKWLNKLPAKLQISSSTELDALLNQHEKRHKVDVG